MKTGLQDVFLFTFLEAPTPKNQSHVRSAWRGVAGVRPAPCERSAHFLASDVSQVEATGPRTRIALGAPSRNRVLQGWSPAATKKMKVFMEKKLDLIHGMIAGCLTS